MVLSSGDTAWLLLSAALVMFMTPGLALFYGGMVGRKNVLSTYMMSFAFLGLIGILWVLYGYSLSFGKDIGGLIGGLDYIGLNNVGQTPSPIYAPTVPHLAFMAFQAMTAVITVALFTGAVVGRIKFSALLTFSVLWFTLIYCPVAHWVWGDGGWLLKLGVLDFAGGTVVHIAAGFSALALAWLVGPRQSTLKNEEVKPHNIPMVVLGAGILWFGWFGFNAGSALTSGGLAANAFVATNISGAAAALAWFLLEWMYGRPSLIGIASGAVAGLVAITPGAGFVPPIAGIPIGAIASIICFYAIRLRKKTGIDDALDVFGVHGVGGTWGVIAAGIFCSLAVNPAGANGLLTGNPAQLLKQLLGIGAVGAFAFVGTIVLGKIVNAIVGLRVSEKEEEEGLDISQHGEQAYDDNEEDFKPI